MSDDLIDRARAAIKHAKRLGVPSPLLSDMADEIARLRAEVERLKEAERTAWERGRDAAADEIDAKCERTCDYPDGCRCEAAKAIRALTPEASHD